MGKFLTNRGKKAYTVAILSKPNRANADPLETHNILTASNKINVGIMVRVVGIKIWSQTFRAEMRINPFIHRAVNPWTFLLKSVLMTMDLSFKPLLQTPFYPRGKLDTTVGAVKIDYWPMQANHNCSITSV